MFKGWLVPHSNNNKGLCTLCNRTIVCIKTHLIKHSQSVSHIQKASQNFRKQIKIVKILFLIKIKLNENKISGFFAKHNVLI